MLKFNLISKLILSIFLPRKEGQRKEIRKKGQKEGNKEGRLEGREGGKKSRKAEPILAIDFNL